MDLLTSAARWLGLVLVAWAGPVLAEKRLALVIGNDAYPGLSLEQSIEDAYRVRNALQDIGFFVDLQRNLPEDEFRDSIRRFSARLAGAGRDTIAVFYYTGAAGQTQGRNYLLPVDARPVTERDLVDEGVELAEVIQGMQSGGAGGRIVLIDAAMRLPWQVTPPRITPGLARAKAPPGFLIGFAQEPDRTAKKFGYYAAALDETLHQPGLPLDALFSRVRRAVLELSGGEQSPWEHAALDLAIRLNGQAGESVPARNASAEDAFWFSIRDGADLARFEEYLARFPHGLYVEAARRRLRSAASRSFRDCPQCPAMISLPRDSFFMGADEANSNEAPAHLVSIDYPLAIGEREVSFAEWDACVADGGCTYEPPDKGWGRDERPVIFVSWSDAQEYVAWLSKKTKRRYRLPSEAEWEYAARGGTRTEYPWGDAIEVGRAHCYGCSGNGPAESTEPAGQLAPNGLGLHDVAGNVSEWVQDCYVDGYAGAPSDGRPRLAGLCEYRAFRGGSWNDEPERLRPAFRNGGLAGLRSSYLGFRVARSP